MFLEGTLFDVVSIDQKDSHHFWASPILRHTHLFSAFAWAFLAFGQFPGASRSSTLRRSEWGFWVKVDGAMVQARFGLVFFASKGIASTFAL